ncbi:MAG TPA: phosphomethylpyrimidine synthase [Archaeoglobaceae archaeon]|nr:phosphomethylpyrimidine synthase [Archaeoglobaceae archaeon]
MDTLMELVKKNSPPEWMNEVAKYEGIDTRTLTNLISKGEIVIFRNNLRNDDFSPRAVGRLVSTKINANIGTSADYVNVEEEVEKAIIAQKYGADAIMDLSTGGDIGEIRRKIIKSVNIPIGTVPIYQAAREAGIVVDMDEDDFFNAVEKQGKDGVDFMTIHAGVNWTSIERLKKSGRLLGVVSRGGAITVGWMLHNEMENPYYENFDYLLELLKEFNITISLGDAFRPGCIHDAGDRVKFTEFILLGELVEKCRDEGVQSIVEGPGHVPLNEIETSVKAMKSLTRNAPLYLLGPIVTDIASGYDHIASAIGAAIAGMHGADFLCYVTPSEHLALPSVKDVNEGVIASKIAAHAIDLIKEGQKEKAREKDFMMSLARKNLDWETQFKLSIDPENARKIWENRKSKSESCSICGDLCAIKLVKEAFGDESETTCF